MTGICIGITLLSACKPAQEEAIVLDKPVPVGIEKIKVRDLPLVVNSTGRLEPNREVVLSAELPGIVNNYTADVGDEVLKGQVLVMRDARL